MFKNIQKYLLINHPLLWNIKIVPATAILLIINLIFFVIGYFTGGLDFNENGSDYNYDSNVTVIFFAVLLSVLSLIIWLVYYFKNNSFKSFYPKTNLALFKEWALIVFICFLITLFTSSFYFGKDVKLRSYFTKNEAKKRCEILSKGSFFVEGSFSSNYNDRGVSDDIAEPAAAFASDSTSYFKFKGKKYSWNSLLNKNINSYTFFDFKADSIHKNTLRNWLVNQQKDSIKQLFKNYLAIANEHHLKANIDVNKWFDLIYNYPDFESKTIIGNNQVGENYYADNYKNANQKFDSNNKYIGIVKGQKYEFYKYYVPEKNLNYNYSKIADSYNNPIISFDTILISIYIAIALSLLVFSFRVTSGKNWLIAVVGIGVINILLGIFSVIISSEYTYPISLILVILALFGHFIFILIQKKNKKLSAITLNGLLWLFPAVIPLIYFIVLTYYKAIPLYNNGYNVVINNPIVKALEDNYITMFYLNLLFVIIMMIFFSIKIKKWRGIAEE